MRTWTLCAAAALVAAGCASPAADPDGAPPPSAPPTASELLKAAKADHGFAKPDPQSQSRVLAYVEGEVITYRELLQSVGPQLAQLAPEEKDEKAKIEDQALMDILTERLLYRAAVDAGVRAGRDEIDLERADFVKSLAKNGGTLEGYLHERDMSRREHDEVIKRQLVVEKYHRAAVGRGVDPRVRVRAVADTYVSPAEVAKFYDRHLDKFHLPAIARVRMLAVKTDLDVKDREAAVAAARAKAEGALARLQAGEDWVPVYRQTAQDADDQRRPDGLEELRRGEKAAWIEEFAFKSAKGELSKVEQVGTTFYVLKAEGSHEARTASLEEAEMEIRRTLAHSKLQAAWIEVELSVLDESSVEPSSMRTRLREALRKARVAALAD